VLCVGTLPLTVLWSVIYLLAGVPSAAAIPAFYSVFTPINTALFAWSRNLGLYRFTQLLMILVLPWLVTLSLGGFGQSSMVIIWAALCPLGALLLEDIARTLFWLLGFVVLLPATAMLQPYLAPANLSETFVTWFFVLNIGCVIAVVFGLVYYFVGQRNFFQERSERLLLNILPKEISEVLKVEQRTIAAHYDAASILFADVVEFTPMAARMTPLRLVDLLNEVFQCFDSLVEKYDLIRSITWISATTTLASREVRHDAHYRGFRSASVTHARLLLGQLVPDLRFRQSADARHSYREWRSLYQRSGQRPGSGVCPFSTRASSGAGLCHSSGHLHCQRDVVRDGRRHVWVPSTAFIVPVPADPAATSILGIVSVELDVNEARIETIEIPGLVIYDLAQLKGHGRYKYLRDMPPCPPAA
jgi:hypothetical protein